MKLLASLLVLGAALLTSNSAFAEQGIPLLTVTSGAEGEQSYSLNIQILLLMTANEKTLFPH